MYFWTYGLWKTWLDQFQKSPVLEDPSTGNMVNGQKRSWNLNDATFSIFIDACEKNSVEKVFLSDTQNRRTVFWLIDSQWQALSS